MTEDESWCSLCENTGYYPKKTKTGNQTFCGCLMGWKARRREVNTQFLFLAVILTGTVIIALLRRC